MECNLKKSGRTETLDIIKGPKVDYSYVIEEEKFAGGAKIVKEQGHGNWLWLILEGVVNVLRDTPDGQRTIARLGEGCFIGTPEAFIQRENVRTASVVAEGKVYLGLIDTPPMHKEYSALSKDSKRLIDGLTNKLKRISDSAIELITGNTDSIQLPNEKKRPIKPVALEQVFSIKEGRLYLMQRTWKGPHPLLTLEAGDVFGDLPFYGLGIAGCQASVLASKDLSISWMDRDLIQREYDGLSNTFKNLIVNLDDCMKSTTSFACHATEC